MVVDGARGERRARPPSLLRVSDVEVVRFVDGNRCVASWLGKYMSGPRGGLSGSKLNKARILCRFFKWLRVVKGISLSPHELLKFQAKKRKSDDPIERKWLLFLVLEHSRDNPDFKGYSDIRKYDIFQCVKNFCEHYEVSLTTAKNVYGRRRKKKNWRKQITLAEAKKFLGRVSQRNRAILLIMLQSGMGIGEVLNKFGYRWHSQVKPQLEARCECLRIEFDDRKATGRWYYTYVSRDGIHELRKWLMVRKRIVEGLLEDGKEVSQSVIEGEPIFITSRAKMLSGEAFAHQLRKRSGGRVTSHMFRKLFKSEASVPDRAIDRKVIEFFMGHVSGIDAVGGEYDRNPEIREEVLEKEYAKLEPFINIYSAVQVEPLTEESREWMRFYKALWNAVKDDREKQEKFLRFLKTL